MLRKLLSFTNKPKTVPESSEKQRNEPIPKELDKSYAALQQTFDQFADVVFRRFQINGEKFINAFVIYIEGLCDEQLTSGSLLKSVMKGDPNLDSNQVSRDGGIQFIVENLISTPNAKTTQNLSELAKYVLDGNLALLVDGASQAIIAGVQGWDKRHVSEPNTEPVVRGPRDGFVEDLRTNTATIRRRLKTTRLKSESFELGTESVTSVEMFYLKGVANDLIVDEVRQRILRIKIDGILESGYIEEFIRDEKYTLFPLIQHTERPDKAASALLEGKVILIVDTTPMTLIMPVTVVSLMQSSEDYYMNAPFATFVRVLRFTALNIALLLPALYIAVTTYHQEILPPQLMESILSSRAGIPFPGFVEALIMELTFEVLREAGVRLPRNVGQAVSTVGGIVIGQAAVTAGLVSPAMVIVVSLTAIASFAMPNYAVGFSLRMLRFTLMVLASVLGIPGIMLGLMGILIHLCSLRSFGVPYLAPFAPFILKDIKDTWARVPWFAMDKRPTLEAQDNQVRQAADLGPSKPEGED